MRRSMASDLERVADTGVGELPYKPDPLDPDLPDAFVEALRDPMPIQSVEAIEQVAKDMFRQQLAEPDNRDPASMRAFVNFFHALGFLFKYKPYGVKAASPFGYSIFDLHPGQGFSFQLHREPKYEAFHILRAHPNSFLYLSTHPEWLESGESAAVTWAHSNQNPSTPYTIATTPGDVARVTSTEIVHTVVGCTLEEYATTSLDAVERLLDQNDRASLQLPKEHPKMREMVQELHPDLPQRLLARSESGWNSTTMSTSEPIIDVPDQLTGQRIRVAGGMELDLPAPTAWVKVVVPTTSAVRCTISGEEWTVSPGQLFAVPAGWDARAIADDTTVITLHSIAPRLVLGEWAR